MQDNGNVQETTITRPVEFTLSEDDCEELVKSIGDVALKLQELRGDKAKLEADHKDSLHKLNEQIRGQQKKLDEDVEVCREGKRARICDVLKRIDYSTGNVTFWYDGKQIEERTITPDEAQLDMLQPPVLPQDQEQGSNVTDIEQVRREETSRRTKTDSSGG